MWSIITDIATENLILILETWQAEIGGEALIHRHLSELSRNSNYLPIRKALNRGNQVEGVIAQTVFAFCKECKIYFTNHPLEVFITFAWHGTWRGSPLAYFTCTNSVNLISLDLVSTLPKQLLIGNMEDLPSDERMLKTLKDFRDSNITLVEWETPLLQRLGYPLAPKPVSQWGTINK